MEKVDYLDYVFIFINIDWDIQKIDTTIILKDLI